MDMVRLGIMFSFRDASCWRVEVPIETESAGYRFRASHSSVKFNGFTAVYEESRGWGAGICPPSPRTAGR